MSRGKSDSFDAIPELFKSDGDLTLGFLSGNGVGFSQPMDDDWYRATVPLHKIQSPSRTGYTQTYRPDVSASPMGCIEQWQFCNSSYTKDHGCGPLGSFADALDGAAPMFGLDLDSASQDISNLGRPASSNSSVAPFIWLYLTMTQSPTSLSWVLESLQSKSLASHTRLIGGLQYPIPNKQWQLDVLNWYNMVLALVQTAWSVFLSPSPRGCSVQLRPSSLLLTVAYFLLVRQSSQAKAWQLRDI